MKYAFHLAGASFCWGVLLWIASASVTWNVSASAAPIGWYYRTSGKPQRGDLVELRNPLKRLVGVPGDRIEVTKEGTRVNGKLLPNSAVPEGSPYRPYPFGAYILQIDQYLCFGDDPRSWDGRYLGPEPGVLIKGKVERW